MAVMPMVLLSQHDHPIAGAAFCPHSPLVGLVGVC